MNSETLFYIYLSVIVIHFLFGRWLEFLNSRARMQPVPEEGKGIYDEEKYMKSQRYHAEHDRFGRIESFFSFSVMMVFLFLDGFAWLDGCVREITENPLLVSLLFFFILAVANDIIGIPFDIYSTFVIEEKYGFNKTTPSTFIFDKLKGYLLMIVIGGPLLIALVYFFEYSGEYFWMLSWGILSLFMLVMAMFYTSVFLPLFNKITPLPEGELRSAIEAYGQKNGFQLKNIFVMDGSRRSTKANAFFSGFGPKKTIVLYDTLIEKHTTEELVAVLAHEVGHYKLKHTVSGLVASLVQSAVLLYLLSFFIGNKEMAMALGVSQPSFHIGVIAFSILYTPVSVITGILMNVISRKNEFAADAFARKTSDGEALKTALKKLSVDNLSNLTPHPAYVFMYYSHPPLLERLKALDKK
ncbi:MAG: M48 family metallopeptidase [Bacteroidota bacterium]